MKILSNLRFRMKIIHNYLYSEGANSISYRMHGFAGNWLLLGFYFNRAASRTNWFLVRGARYTAHLVRCMMYDVRCAVHGVRCAAHGGRCRCAAQAMKQSKPAPKRS